MFRKRLMAAAVSAAMCLSLTPGWVYANVETEEQVSLESTVDETDIQVSEEFPEETSEDVKELPEDTSEDIQELTEDGFDAIEDAEEFEIVDDEVTQEVQEASATYTGSIGANARYSIRQEGNEWILEISGTGRTYDFSTSMRNPLPDCQPYFEISELRVSSGITYIGDNALWGCTSLEKVTLPDTLNGIGTYAFECCSKLTQIEIPDSVTSIGVGAFRQTGLKEVFLPDSVITVGTNAFSECRNLEYVYLDNDSIILGTKLLDGSAHASLIFRKGSKR